MDSHSLEGEIRDQGGAFHCIPDILNVVGQVWRKVAINFYVVCGDMSSLDFCVLQYFSFYWLLIYQNLRTEQVSKGRREVEIHNKRLCG